MKNNLPEFQKRIHEKIRDEQSYLGELIVPILSNETYWGFRSSEIKKIIIPEKIIPVPGAKNFILGVCHVGGTIYTVIDFNVLMGRAHHIRTSKTRIICFDSKHGNEQSGEVAGKEEAIALFVERAVDMISESNLERAESKNKHAECILKHKSADIYLTNASVISNLALA